MQKSANPTRLSRWDKVESKIVVTVYFANQLIHYKTGLPIFDYHPGTTIENRSKPKTSMFYHLKDLRDKNYPVELKDSKAKSLLELQVAYELMNTFDVMKPHHENQRNIIENITFYTNTKIRTGEPNKALTVIKYSNNRPYEILRGKDLPKCVGEEQFLVEMFTNRFPPYFLNTINGR